MPPVLEWWRETVGQILQSVHTKKGHIHISEEVAVQMTCFPNATTPSCVLQDTHRSFPVSWEGEKMVMRLFPPGCPRNKQLFSQKSRHYSQTLFLLCPLQGPPVWESCGCGVKNKISMVVMRSRSRKILSVTYYEPSRTATGSAQFLEWQVQPELLQ